MAKRGLRPRLRSWRRKIILRALAWAVLTLAAGAALYAGAVRSVRLQVFPVQGLANFESGDPEGRLKRELSEAVLAEWKGRNRFWCAAQISKVKRRLLENHPYLKDIRVGLRGLLGEGVVDLSFKRRAAVALVEHERGPACLDGAGFEFFCPPRENIAQMARLDGGFKSRQERRSILEAMERLAQVSVKPLARARRFGEGHIIFEDPEGGSYEFSLADVMRQDRFESALEHLALVLEDVLRRQEKFRYIDSSMAWEGRIFLKPDNDEVD